MAGLKCSVCVYTNLYADFVYNYFHWAAADLWAYLLHTYSIIVYKQLHVVSPSLLIHFSFCVLCTVLHRLVHKSQIVSELTF